MGGALGRSNSLKQSLPVSKLEAKMVEAMRKRALAGTSMRSFNSIILKFPKIDESLRKCKSIFQEFGFLILFVIFFCAQAYDLTQLVSSFYFKGYASLTKIQRTEWNNRGMSSAHAVFITIMSLYLVFFSDLYSDHREGLVTFRSSNISTFTLGVSIGYFIADLAMIFWLFPLLGGMEYVFHHLLSLCAISYSMLTGEGQLYAYMVLISEATTPGVNLRWFLDTGGMKRSKAYLINGIVMFFAWLVARILLFIYLFYHIYLHYEQIYQMHTFGYLLAFVVPAILAVMNTMWFGKILKGLKKQLAKRQ